ncbi:MAG: SIS domain-containing protein [Candidatus Aureabacteria bacterium]|jgi:D-sedoheptulose 7-phosphate isomerase|nr:SIS domain-containing protein [Candidatus Auribacterota bacterium]
MRNADEYGDYIRRYLEETAAIAGTIDREAILKAARLLAGVRDRGGRLFILGVGGSAANASHAVNDFRKIAGIEAYAPTDNVAELTAWTNDEDWGCVFANWLKESRLRNSDALLVFSVGGGSSTTSVNLVRAMEYAGKIGASVAAIVSRDGGKAKGLAGAVVLVPVVAVERITPHAEGWQSVIWHLLVNCI